MSFKNYLYGFLLICFCISCAPSFDLEKEQIKIKNTVFNGSDFTKRIDIFYADSNKSDSLKKVINENKPAFELLLNELEKDSTQGTIKIKNISATITIQDRLFRIVNVTESFILPKKSLKIAYEDFENYIQSNLYHYTVDDTQYTITGDTNFLAIYHKNSWEYFNFNVSMIYHAYGLTATKKLVQLYYDEIFEPAKEERDTENFQHFKELYYEKKNLPQYKDLDFDAYCECMFKHHEKLDSEKILETNYFESETYLNKIYSCRILTTRE